MKYLAALLSVIRYVLYSVLSILAVLVTWMLAGLVVFFVKEDPITKQGDLPSWLQWMRSHDFPLDEVWRPSLKDGTEDWREDGLFIKNFEMFNGLTTKNFLESKKLRRKARMFWLWRNPAYGFRAKVLGVKHYPSIIVLAKTWGGKWDTGTNSLSIDAICKPEASLWSRYTFHIRAQLFYGKDSARYTRVNVGWKLVMPEIAMIATHVNPFRKWDKPTT